MHITLIGMSSIGKSHWARWLAKNRGFRLIDCDQMIKQKLTAEGVQFDATGTLGLSQWMGQPYEPRYTEASRVYVEREKTVMRDAIETLRATLADPGIVIDTTGSIIYTGDDIIDRLRSLSKVIYFQASPEHISEIFARDLTNPKPLIWDSCFSIQAGEKPEDARKRCFPGLIESRAQRYEKMAHITIPYEQHLKLDTHMNMIFGQAT